MYKTLNNVNNVSYSPFDFLLQNPKVSVRQLVPFPTPFTLVSNYALHNPTCNQRVHAKCIKTSRVESLEYKGSIIHLIREDENVDNGAIVVIILIKGFSVIEVTANSRLRSRAWWRQ